LGRFDFRTGQKEQNEPTERLNASQIPEKV
jgi:hypothetical protein